MASLDQPRPFEPHLEGLRGLAVLLVVLFHTAPGALPGGFIGVDIFFVLSGYLIGGGLAREAAAGSVDWKGFYFRRARRILPAMTLMLVTLWVGALFVLDDQAFKELGAQVLSSGIWATNLLLWHESGYFDAAAQTKPLLHLWSLSIEEQCYLAAPALFWLAARWWSDKTPEQRLKRMWLLIGAIAAISLAACLLLARFDRAAAFYLMPTRSWELAAGALLGISKSRNYRASLMPSGAGAGGLAMAVLVAYALAWRSWTPFPSIWAVPVVCASVLLIGRGCESVALRSSALRGLGRVSYAWYLWHWPVMVLAQQALAGWPSLRDLAVSLGGAEHAEVAVRALAACLALALAWMSTLYVEEPLRRQGSRTLGMRLAMVFTMALSPAVLAVTDGNPMREASIHTDEALWRSQGRWTDPACLAAYSLPADRSAGTGKNPDWYCLGDPRSADVLVLGDSHANQLVPGLREAMPGAKVAMLGYTACPPVPGVSSHEQGYSDGCREANARILAQLHAGIKARLVVLAARWPIYITGKGFGPSFGTHWLVESPDGLHEADAVRRGLEDLIHQLQAPGREIVLVGPTPELDFLPDSCLGKHDVLKGENGALIRRDGQPCAMSAAAVNARGESSRVLLRQVGLELGAEFADPSKVLCADGWCAVDDAQGLRYRDANHLSLRGSALLVEGLMRRGFFGAGVSDR